MGQRADCTSNHDKELVNHWPVVHVTKLCERYAVGKQIRQSLRCSIIQIPMSSRNDRTHARLAA